MKLFSRLSNFVHQVVVEKMCIRRIDNAQNEVFLTFDDGLDSEITEWTLFELRKYNAKATFFCLGEKTKLNRDCVTNVLDEGHKIGSHTMTHPNGLETGLMKYVNEVIKFNSVYKTRLFRPPYGSISTMQTIILRLLHYRICLWSVDSYDWMKECDNESKAHDVIRTIRSGDIILLHSSVSHINRTKVVLPIILEELFKKDYKYGLL